MKILYAFLMYFIYATCFAHLILLDLIILIMFSEKLWSFDCVYSWLSHYFMHICVEVLVSSVQYQWLWQLLQFW
jgi:hypothetical protein